MIIIIRGISVLSPVREVYKISWDGKSMDFGVRQTWVGKLALSLAGWMALDTLLNLPNLSLLVCKTNNNVTLIGLL